MVVDASTHTNYIKHIYVCNGLIQAFLHAATALQQANSSQNPPKPYCTKEEKRGESDRWREREGERCTQYVYSREAKTYLCRKILLEERRDKGRGI